MVKVNVIEQSALKRVLEIEIPPEEVERGLGELVEEYRRSMVIPGFRKGKVPSSMVRAQIGQALDTEYLKRALPRAYVEAVEESKLNPVGEPEIKDLEFKTGQPLRFKAHIEVWPEFLATGYRDLSLIREEFEIADEDVDRALAGFREGRAEFDPVDRPAQGGDVVAVDYWLLDAQGQRGEMKNGTIEIGGSGTPEPFNAAIMGASAGESRRVTLPATSHTTEEGVHEHPEQVFDLVLKEVREKRLPPLNDEFARGAMGSETATLEELKARIRLNLEGQEQFRSRERFEEVLFDELISRNPFELPESVIQSALSDVVESARKDQGNLTDEDVSRLKETYRPAVERRFRKDLIVASVGEQENVTVTDDEVEAEIARFAEREGKTPDEVRGQIQRANRLDRLKDDMYRHKVIETLFGLARIEVIKKRRN